MNAPSLMSNFELTDEEQTLLQDFRGSVSHISHLAWMLGKTGIGVQFNINIATGVCDRFEVFRSVKIDMP